MDRISLIENKITGKIADLCTKLKYKESVMNKDEEELSEYLLLYNGETQFFS